MAASASIPPTPQPRTPEAVDHGGVRVGTHHRVRVGLDDTGPIVIGCREHHARQILAVDLVNDASVGRNHGQVAERGLTPAQKAVALLVALELELVVAGQGTRVALLVDLHRVIDDQLGRQ